ncbi:gliding motility-associated-like protein [Flavobacterium sp. CG_23.5]|uniref:PKD-like domain-containing protein n=1 Tax=Flavobacterium sp. CG_23.5 TaxID=2760708 RepID=UPI001AE52EE0|nr:PKD-like domain-containing protein [Flavobacterium sp. CG_23.5]MBP2281685.1 gliding motility-associated-like protein [Flavobacterium sp. CG_23.5]
MKHLFKVLFLFVLLILNASAVYSSNKIEEIIKLKTVADPTGQITGNTTVCQNAAQPIIVFEVDDNVKGPYTFTYTINGGALISATTTANNKSLTVSQPTNVTGTFSYILTGVMDKDGKNVVVSSNNTVTIIVNPLPAADFTFIDTQCSGTAVQFNTTSSGNSYTWNFGDGNTSSEKNPTHIFTSLGCGTAPFNITLTVTDANGCSSTITKIITINQQPNVNFIDSSVNYNPLNLSNQFNNCNSAGANPNYNVSVSPSASNSSCINSYSVLWDDGGTPQIFTSFPFTHSYTTLGAFTMAITAIGGNGCSTTKKYIIKNESNPAGGLVSPGSTTNLCAPTPELKFTLSNWALNSPGTTYTLDYGDSSPMIQLLQSDLMQNSLYYNSANPSLSSNYPVPHIYSTSSCPNASITATLKISNSCGTTNSTISPIIILRSPTSNFTNPPKACVNTCVQFTNTSTPASNEGCLESTLYEWNFGDGSSIYSTTAAGTPNPPCHTYTSPGKYTVTLTTYGYCGTSIKTGEICIEPPLVPNFTAESSGCSPQAITATNTTVESNSCSPPTYVWSTTFVPSSCGTTIAPIPNQTSANGSFNFTEPGTYSIKLTATNSCTPSQSVIKTFTVKQPPKVTIAPIAPLCQTGVATVINPTATIINCGTQSPLTYEWSFPNGIPATATTANPGPISYTSSGTFPISLKVTNECGTTTVNSSITIKPTPTVDNITSQQKCKGQQSDAIVFSGGLTGTVYNWTNNNTAIGLMAADTGDINPFILTNTGTTVLTATITVTPSLNGCSGPAKTFTITVNPEATVSTVSNSVLCNTSLQNAITFSSSSALTTFSWSNNAPSIGLAASGTGNIPAFTATNAGISPVVATITVTPSNALGCNGIPKTFTITVNPTPTPLVLTNQEYCNGVATSPIIFSNNVSGTTYTWINSNVAIGLAANGTGNIPAFTPKNTSGNPITATISVTPKANGCTGTWQDFTITVNPSPVVTFSIQNQTICSGDTSALVTLSTVAGATLNWTAIQPSGMSGVATSGTNTIPAQPLVNNTNANIVVTYNASSTLSSGATCAGATFLYTITVKPKPIIAANMAANSCSGLSFSIIPTNGAGNNIPTGTTYSWSTPIVTGGISGGISGTNQTNISGTLNNTTTVVQTATYTVIPSLNGCAGLPFDVVVSVNPKPDVNANTDIVLCAGDTGQLINFSGNVSGTTYNWSSNLTNIGIAASGSNSVPTFTAINTGLTPIIATVTVTPSANSCTGLSKTFKITVNPRPNINSITNLVKCNGIASGTILFTGSVNGTTFDWTNDTPSIGLAASGNGNIPSFTTINTGLIPVIATITVTPKANGCFGTPTTFTITVNPTPTVDLASNQTVCNVQSTTAIVFSGAIPNTSYNWNNSNSNIGLGANGVGDIPAFNAINNGTTPIIATITVTPTLNGCPGASKTFTITINPSPTVSFTSSNQVVCSGSSSTIVNLTSTSGTSFSWTALQPSGILGVLTSGTNTIPVQTLINSTNVPIVVTYLATAESNSGVSCQGITYPYTITVNPVSSITTTQAQTICSNSTFSVVPLDGSGNSVPVGTTYSWSAPVVTGGITGGVALANQTTIKGTLNNPTNDVQTATYTVIPKSGTCTGPTFTTVITVNPSPKVQFSAANQTICSGSASLPITLSTLTTGNVTFNWTATIPAGISGGTGSGTGTIPTQTLLNLTTTPLTVIYTATATFENNGVSCSGPTLDYKITVNPAIITSSILSNYNGFNVSSVGANDGAINVTVTGGSGTYTYLWSGPPGFSALSQDISNVPAGDYTLTINDALCNPVILNFTLTAPLPLLIQEDNAAQIDVLCFGYLTGAIKVDITQQSVGPYDYLLTLQGGGTISSIINATSTNYTFTSLAAGIYDIKVTDANGSSKTILGIEITQPSGISATISYPTIISCAGSATGSATVSASGGIGTLTYSWNTNPIQTTETASGLIAGTYTVTITDANNCSIQKQAVITEPNGIVASITSLTNVLCFGNNTGSATVSATGGTGVLTYSWDTVSIQTTVTATGLVAGTYKVTITDANGCSNVQTALITQPSAGLTAMISNSTNVSCFGGNNGNATVSVTGGTSPYTYSWNTNPIQTSVTATGLTAGTYNVTVTDANGCVDSSPVTITEPAGMSATISAQTDVYCSGNSSGSATVTVNGGTAPYGYSWNTTPVQTSATATNLAVGTYTAIITDANGCTTSTQATITEPNGIVISIASQTNVKCFGNNTGSVSVLASGGTGILTYSWDTIPVQTSLNAIGLIAGTYHLTVTDANNCTKVETVNITQPDDISITTDLEKDITCFNDANGEIKITISGGTLKYNYTWSKDGIPYSAAEDLSNLSPGIYMVTVSDANNCGPKTATFTITEPPILEVSLLSQTNILCFGEATGAIEIFVVGGTPTLSGYSFSWTGPNGFTSSNKNLTAITAGTYNVLVTDNSGCSKALSVTLTQPTAIILSATTTPIICYGSNDASITLAINGGVTPYTIAWSNLGGGTFQNNLSAGDYLITVTDSNNCVKTLNVNIPEAPIFTINPVVKNISCFGAHDGSINLNIIGGIAPVKLVWDDSPVAGNVRNNLGPGSYTVTIVDSKPCTIKKSFIILEPQPLILSANVDNAFDCDKANSGAINLLVAGGTPPFTYAWSNGSTTEDLVNIPAGNYLVTVIDSRGCSKQAQYSINRPPPIVIGVATKTEFDCETKFVKQTFVAQVSGGVPPYQLAWSSGTVSGSNNEMMNTSQNGTAILYVTDALGCKANYSFNVKLQSLGTPSFNATSYSFVTYGTYSIIDPIQFTNTATGDFISMVWDFGDGSFSTELNPVHTFLNPKEYVVTQTVTYPFGCVYVQKITFNVEKGYLFVVPTAFTPNNDNMNDTFRPVTKALKNVRLDIYDTWGSLIYSETGDTLRGWDGKIKGQIAENGNYYCKVSAETFYGTIVNENRPFVLIK